MPERTAYGGRSLAWVRRELLRKPGPLMSSALSMANRYKDRLVQEPKPGMVCFFGDREPGDCGLYMGSDLIKMMDYDGYPRLRRLSEVPDTFLGAMYWPE